ncbi:MAG: site-2 protease family protein [Peptococcaceae bacterium]|nr:site-2 protease family protein [Peptococcaceae bacterium]
MDFSFLNIERLIYLLPGFIIGLTFHEYAHGWMAYRLGDNTARSYGRLTLNPIAHLDPIGLLMLYFAGFGWAKPVPVNPYNLKVDIKQGMLLVAFAGPATNIVVALICTLVLGIFAGFNIPHFNNFMMMAIQINVVLAVFNLLPIPPLDGSRILAGMLPGEHAWLNNLEQYGFIILIVLVITGAIGTLFRYIVYPIVTVLFDAAFVISSIFRFW